MKSGKPQDEEELINRTQQPQQVCQNYLPVQVFPHIKTKLKEIKPNTWLFGKEVTLFNVMHKVHQELDGAKNLYFYVKKKDGQYGLLKPELKLMQMFKKFKNQDGYLRIYYHNDLLSRSKVIDVCFIVAQVVVVVYLLIFLYGFLKSHDYI